MILLDILHLCAAIIWVGGLFFAYFILRPAAVGMPPEIAMPMYERVLSRFFSLVWVLVGILIATGYFRLAMGTAGLHVTLKQATGLAMIALFLFVWFVPYARIKRAAATQDYPAIARQLGVIRNVMRVNIPLGLISSALGLWQGLGR
jgi:uncharacterized membrane protein